MADTVNLAAGARLLGVSVPTARKRLSRSYNKTDRIRGAKRIGREWRIPRSEIQRLVQLSAKESAQSLDAKAAFAIAFAVADDVDERAYDRLVKAAQAFVGASHESEAGDALRELKIAMEDWTALQSSAAMIIDAIAARVEDRKWLEEEMGWP
jgi:hypothetical protein